jgi:hypothetical protein
MHTVIEHEEQPRTHFTLARSLLSKLLQYKRDKTHRLRSREVQVQDAGASFQSTLCSPVELLSTGTSPGQGYGGGAGGAALGGDLSSRSISSTSSSLARCRWLAVARCFFALCNARWVEAEDARSLSLSAARSGIKGIGKGCTCDTTRRSH